MTCPACGSPTSSGSCQKCATAPSPGGWGGSFDSWGSSGSAEWGAAIKTPPRSTALASPPVPAQTPGWGQIPISGEGDGWGSATVATSNAAPVSAARSDLYQPDNWAPPAEDGASAAAQSQPGLLAQEQSDCRFSGREGWSGVTESDSSQESRPLWSEQDDTVRDAWLDEDEDDDSVEIPEDVPVQGGGAVLWAAVVATAFLVLLGFYALHKSPKAETAVPPNPKQIAAESLKDGRRLVVAGKSNQKDPYLAASQFENAIPKLKNGGAGGAEIQDARRLWAQALMGAREFQEAHSVWKSLHGTPHAAQAAEGIQAANRELRKLAGQQLRDAEGALKAGQPKRAEALAQEALELYAGHGGTRGQVGAAAGALGLAHYEQNHPNDARWFLESAQTLAANQAYAVPLSELRLVTVEPEIVTADPGPQVVVASVDPGTDYPTGQVPRGSGRSRSNRTDSTGPASSQAGATAKPRPQNTFKPSAPKDLERKRVRNTLQSYLNASNNKPKIQR